MAFGSGLAYWGFLCRCPATTSNPENGPERAGIRPTAFLHFPELLLVPYPLQNTVWKRKVGLLKPWCPCFRLSCLSPVVLFCSSCHCGAGEGTMDGAGPQGCSHSLQQGLTGITQGWCGTEVVVQGEALQHGALPGGSQSSAETRGSPACHREKLFHSTPSEDRLGDEKHTFQTELSLGLKQTNVIMSVNNDMAALMITVVLAVWLQSDNTSLCKHSAVSVRQGESFLIILVTVFVGEHKLVSKIETNCCP